MKQSKIRDLEVGELFVTSSKSIDPITDEVKNSSSVWVKYYYDYTCKAYLCYKYDDINHDKFFKGDKEVFFDFTF